MPAIAREQENRIDLINFFISLGGVLTDAFLIEYRIFDITGGIPGTQIFPLPAGTFEDVTNAPGKFATGSYYAFDNTLNQGWTPSATQVIGTHRIEWRWKASSASQFQSGCEDFEVLQSSIGSTGDTYCSVADIRALGLTDTAKYPDADILANIELWQAFLERATRQWFNSRVLLLEIDGTDSDTIHFGVPIIDIEFIKINDITTPLPEDQYKVYNSRSYPDDRRNPRIKLRSLADFPDIFSAPLSSQTLKFRKGRQNTIIKGTFGFVEDDGLTPKLIKRALCKLVIEKLTSPIPIPGVPVVLPPPIISGVLIEEWTDGHKRKYNNTFRVKEGRSNIYQGITTCPEIISIIKMYRAPIGIATPAHPSHYVGVNGIV